MDFGGIGPKSRYFRYVLLTFVILMVLEFSLNIFGIASFKLNPSLLRHFNASQFILRGGGGGGDDEELYVKDGFNNENRDVSPRFGQPVVVKKSIDEILGVTDPPPLQPQNQQSDSISPPRKPQAEEATREEVVVAETTSLTTTTPTTTLTTTTSVLPTCPDPPPKLVGLLRVVKKPIELSTCERLHSSDLAPGGFFTPPDCVARHRVAIIIPFRDREEHLHIFLNHLLPILKRQLLEFQIYVVDLVKGVKFNRAMLMNIGYAEAIKVWSIMLWCVSV